jgi:hypothetical protein
MKALSVRAPWWWFILHGGKDIENRDWPTQQRGAVYLHASKWFRSVDVAYDVHYALGVDPARIVPKGMVLDEVEASRGCIVGQVDIVDCVKYSSSRWFQGKYGFVLANPLAFAKPIPFKGSLGFFDVPDSLVVPK